MQPINFAQTKFLYYITREIILSKPLRAKNEKIMQ